MIGATATEAGSHADPQGHSRPEDRSASMQSTVGDTVAEAAGDAASHASAHHIPHQIGRHEVLRKLGAGGMGVVFEAHDPELDRRIAIKLIRPDPGGTRASETSRGRLMREAQAMAKVSHRNVITVYDVGAFQDRVYIAMEFVQGMTLYAWSQRPRAWRETLEVYLQAAEGLHAAHEVGLVHRDFKPHNVMLGDDGVVRVLDFGLARASAGDDTVDSQPEPSAVSGSGLDTHDSRARLDSKLTRTGAMIGTPAYMSPEQIQGQPADARSDQFSFCVSVWEALFGQRPFVGKSLAEISLAVLEGDITPPPPARAKAVPSWVREVLERGLEDAPAQRFDSMASLAAALRDDPVARRNRRWLALGGVAVAGLAAWFVARAVSGPSALDTCLQAQSELDSAWSAPRAQAMAKVFSDSKLAFADASLQRNRQRLDDYAARWRESHADTCQATHARGTQSAELFERRQLCLTQSRERLAAVAEVLSDPELNAVARADEMVASLPALARCDDAEALMAAVAPPADPALARRVAEARKALASARAWREAGRYVEARHAVDELRATSGALPYPPLQAELTQAAGVLDYELGDYAAAERKLKEGYWLATEARHDALVAETASWLVQVVGVARAQPEAGLDWWRNAKAAFARIGEAPPASLALRHARLLKERGAYAASRDELRAALEARADAGEALDSAAATTHSDLLTELVRVHTALAEYDRAQSRLGELRDFAMANFGEGHPTMARGLHAQGELMVAQGKWAAAHEAHTLALQIELAAYGEAHPRVAESHGRLSAVLRRQEKADQAVAEAREAVKIASASLGPDHPFTGRLITTLGEALLAAGDLPGARVKLQKAHAVAEASFGAQSLEAAIATHRLGDVHLALHEFDLANEKFERAAKLQAQVLGDDHPQLAETHMGLGAVDFWRGDYQAAAEHYFRTLEIRQATLGPDHPAIPMAIMGAAGSYDYTGNIERAAELHAQALEKFRQIHGPDYHMVGTAALNTARAVERLGDFQRSLELANEAERVWMLTAEERYQSESGGHDPEHYEMAYVYAQQGRALVGLERYEEAIEPLERSLRIRLSKGPDLVMRDVVIADSRFSLGRALMGAGQQKRRARELIEQARDAYEQGGPYTDYERGEVARWLAAH